MQNDSRKIRIMCYLFIVIVLCNLIFINNTYKMLFEAQFFISDFNHYYGTSWLILHNIMPYGVKFTTLPIADQFIWHDKIMSATNPPLLGLSTSFLAIFDRNVAYLMWTAVIIFSIIASLVVMMREVLYKWPWCVQLLYSIMFASNAAIVENIYMLQVQSIIFMYLLLGWSALRRKDSCIGGVCWGITIALKFYTLPLLLILVSMKKYKSLLSAIITVIILVYVSLIIMGYDIYHNYIDKGAKIVKEWSVKSTFNVSVFGCLRTLLSYDKLHINDFALSVSVLLFAGLLVLLSMYISANSKNKNVAFDWGTVFFIIIAFAGTVVSWPSYYLFVLIFVAIFIDGNNCSILSILMSSLLILSANIGFGFMNNLIDIELLFKIAMPATNLILLVTLIFVCFCKIKCADNKTLHLD